LTTGVFLVFTCWGADLAVSPYTRDGRPPIA
jgi:hypothetical protein